MSISKAEHDELCCVYAGLLLFDDKIEITGDKLNKVIAASGNTVESYYPEFFAKFLKSVDIEKLLQSVGSAPATSAPTTTTEAPADKKEEKKDDKKGGYWRKKERQEISEEWWKEQRLIKKDEKKKEPEPEEDDMPMGLF